jgi:hypothetical protein
VHGVSFILLDRRALKAVVVITTPVVLLQVETNIRVSLAEQVLVSKISGFVEVNSEAAHFCNYLLLVDIVLNSLQSYEEVRL